MLTRRNLEYGNRAVYGPPRQKKSRPRDRPVQANIERHSFGMKKSWPSTA